MIVFFNRHVVLGAITGKAAKYDLPCASIGHPAFGHDMIYGWGSWFQLKPFMIVELAMAIVTKPL